MPKLGVATHTSPVDCTNISEKKLTYVISGHEYEIDPIDYLVGPVTRSEAKDVQPYLAQLSNSSLRSLNQKDKEDDNITSKISTEYPDSDNLCFGLIVQIDMPNDLFIVGDVFMRKYYSIFDR